MEFLQHHIHLNVPPLLISLGAAAMAALNVYLGGASIVLSMAYTIYKWNQDYKKNNRNNGTN